MDFNAFKDIVVARIPEISGEQLDRFRDMESLYRGWNDKINVISRKDIDELYSHHVLHSDADGSAPAESFFRRYDRARCNPFTVSVDGPTF